MRLLLDTHIWIWSLLAATARVYDLTLVTADSRLLGSRRIATLANQ